MISMQKIIRSRVSTKRLAPIMVDAKKPTFKNERKCVWCMDRDYIHYPNLPLRESCSKSAYFQINIITVCPDLLLWGQVIKKKPWNRGSNQRENA